MPMGDYARLALLASPTEPAQAAERALREGHHWVPLEEADAAIVLGGDGFMLQTLHHMIDSGRIVPAYGLNLGTVGFLMNPRRSSRPLRERIARARAISVAPLLTEAITRCGRRHHLCAINEVSLLRETRQTARLEVTVNGRIRIPELSCDGVLVATPAGSTAYNLSANGPILPLGSAMLALTPISPFRPRRWRGAILPDTSRVGFRVLEPDKRPVSAVADQKELREIAEISVAAADKHQLTLLFDRGHSLDERIVTEQFQV
jgi:NAD+ kinase